MRKLKFSHEKPLPCEGMGKVSSMCMNTPIDQRTSVSKKEATHSAKVLKWVRDGLVNMDMMAIKCITHNTTSNQSLHGHLPMGKQSYRCFTISPSYTPNCDRPSQFARRIQSFRSAEFGPNPHTSVFQHHFTRCNMTSSQDDFAVSWLLVEKQPQGGIRPDPSTIAFIGVIPNGRPVPDKQFVSAVRAIHP